MNAADISFSLLIEKNRREYGEIFDKLNFLDGQEMRDFISRRDTLLGESVSRGALLCFNESKADCRGLSQGCVTCGDGGWSCLFINGICNASCFYCPTEQKTSGSPTTHTLQFPEPRDYLDYLEYFQFRGVSISGGEPFLSFEKSLRLIKSIRNRFGSQIYLWLYTNGILADENKITLLRDAGLNEMRFDIGATSYKLDKVEIASRIMPVVTVEIPAVPEHYMKVKDLLPRLSELGVKHLNLHQLRLTMHNAKHLLKRNYSYIHGKKISVAESEITALQLLSYSIEVNCTVKVNYCSFVYKNRYQGMIARLRTAAVVCKTFEDITEMGYIRSIWVNTGAAGPDALSANLNQNESLAGKWSYQNNGSKLFISQELMSYIDNKQVRMFVRYYDTRFTGSVSYKYPYSQIRLNRGRNIFVERIQCFDDYELKGGEKEKFAEVFLSKTQIREKMFDCIDSQELSYEDKVKWINIYEFEQLPSGMQQ